MSKYLFASLLVLGLVWVKIGIVNSFPVTHPIFFSTLLSDLTIIAIAWIWGLGPGLLAVAISTGTFTFLFLEPVYTFSIHDPTDVIAGILMILQGIVVVLIIAKMRHAEATAKARESQLAVAKTEADKANAEKSTFLASVSHEIRTPLAAVIGFADLLASQTLNQAEVSQVARAVKRNGELLGNLISDLLDLSKLEAGHLRIIKDEVSVEQVLTDIVMLFKPRADEKGLELGVGISPTLPEYVTTDSARLEQMLLNLVGNAIKFTDHGRIDISMDFGLWPDGLYRLSLVVQDTGIGIEQATIPKLFAPFSQADACSVRKRGGTGLGLALSKRLANLLGGDVVLRKTELGKGSVFVATIDPAPFRGNLRDLNIGFPLAQRDQRAV